jgi:predicted RNA-binding protein with PUA-like domain
LSKNSLKTVCECAPASIFLDACNVILTKTLTGSARRPGTPYYDPKSTAENPRWSLVHVTFRKKFAVPITLKELRELGNAPGKPLAEMQMLKQSRLSVSRVSAGEWKVLCDLADAKAKEAGLEHEV